MPAEYTLRYLPVAQDDLRSILDFIAQDNPSRAAPFIEELNTKFACWMNSLSWDEYPTIQNCGNTAIAS